ncbi:LOW QUALITY PROTEIN: low affinity immunoglobulin gamma Fc region receptor II-like, partial [Ammospiza maritima maritima]
PYPAVPSPTLALAGWCPLSPTGAQTTQLPVEPPWRPAVLWDRVTLTCQGLGTAGDTTWYKEGQCWEKEGGNNFTVTERGTYMCERPGTGLSLPMNVSDDWLVLQVVAWALLEGDRVTLHCRGQWNNPVTWVSFHHEEEQLVELRNGTELTLFPLQLHHSGNYSWRGWLKEECEVSTPVTVRVHGSRPALKNGEALDRAFVTSSCGEQGRGITWEMAQENPEPPEGRFGHQIKEVPRL